MIFGRGKDRKKGKNMRTGQRLLGWCLLLSILLVGVGVRGTAQEEEKDPVLYLEEVERIDVDLSSPAMDGAILVTTLGAGIYSEKGKKEVFDVILRDRVPSKFHLFYIGPTEIQELKKISGKFTGRTVYDEKHPVSWTITPEKQKALVEYKLTGLPAVEPPREVVIAAGEDIVPIRKSASALEASYVVRIPDDPRTWIEMKLSYWPRQLILKQENTVHFNLSVERKKFADPKLEIKVPAKINGDPVKLVRIPLGMKEDRLEHWRMATKEVKEVRESISFTLKFTPESTTRVLLPDLVVLRARQEKLLGNPVEAESGKKKVERSSRLEVTYRISVWLPVTPEEAAYINP